MNLAVNIYYRIKKYPQKHILTIFLVFAMMPAIAQNPALDNLQNSLIYTENDSNKVKALIQIAKTFQHISPDSTITYGKKALDLSDKINYLKGKSEALRYTGIGHRIKGNNKKALDYFQKALAIAKKIQNEKLIGNSLNSIAILYHNQSRYEDALNYFRESLKLREKTKDLRGIAYCYNNMAKLYTIKGKNPEALNYLFKALKIKEGLNDKTSIALTYNNIADVYKTQNKYDKALNYYFKSIKIKKELNEKSGIGISLMNVAEIYSIEGKYEEALKTYFETLKIFEGLGIKRGIVQSLSNIGAVYIKLKEVNKAYNYLQKALDINSEINDQSLESLILHLLANYHLYYKNYKEAIKNAEESLDIARKLNYHKYIRNNALSLSQVYETMNKGMDALNYHKIYKAYSDSLFNTENEKKLRILQAEYDYEKKLVLLQSQQKEKELKYEYQLEQRFYLILFFIITLVVTLIIIYFIYRSHHLKYKANLLLQEKNEEISTQKEKLEIHTVKLTELNNLKAKLFSIVAHDLRSPLNSLKSVLDLMKENALTKVEIKDILVSLSKDVHYTSDLTNNLLFWAESQMTGAVIEPTTFDLSKLSEDYIALFTNQALQKGIELIDQIHSESYVYADQDMIALVIRNLLSNAIKFCSEGDKISILAKNTTTFLEVMVCDTGTGIKNQHLPKVFGNENFSTNGTNNEKGTGLGLMLCKDFIEKNHGEIWVESTFGKGSTFYFTLPKK